MTAVVLLTILPLTAWSCRSLRAAAADIDRALAQPRHLRIVP